MKGCPVSIIAGKNGNCLAVISIQSNNYAWRQPEISGHHPGNVRIVYLKDVKIGDSCRPEQRRKQKCRGKGL